MRSNSGGSLNSTPQRPRQISQVSLMSTASTMSELSMVSSGPEDSFNTTPSPSKFSPLKNPNLSYASLPRSFTRQSSSSTSSPGDVKASPSSLSDIPTTPVRKLFNHQLMTVMGAFQRPIDRLIAWLFDRLIDCAAWDLSTDHHTGEARQQRHDQPSCAAVARQLRSPATHRCVRRWRDRRRDTFNAEQ